MAARFGDTALTGLGGGIWDFIDCDDYKIELEAKPHYFQDLTMINANDLWHGLEQPKHNF